MKYHMAGLFCALALASVWAQAQGNCVGSGYVYTCVDSAVNNAYQGVRPGPAAQANGYPTVPGNAWNQVPSPGYPSSSYPYPLYGNGEILHYPARPGHRGHHHHEDGGRGYGRPCHRSDCR